MKPSPSTGCVINVLETIVTVSLFSMRLSLIVQIFKRHVLKTRFGWESGKQGMAGANRQEPLCVLGSYPPRAPAQVLGWPHSLQDPVVGKAVSLLLGRGPGPAPAAASRSRPWEASSPGPSVNHPWGLLKNAGSGRLLPAPSHSGLCRARGRPACEPPPTPSGFILPTFPVRPRWVSHAERASGEPLLVPWGCSQPTIVETTQPLALSLQLWAPPTPLTPPTPRPGFLPPPPCASLLSLHCQALSTAEPLSRCPLRPEPSVPNALVYPFYCLLSA